MDEIHKSKLPWQSASENPHRSISSQSSHRTKTPSSGIEYRCPSADGWQRAESKGGLLCFSTRNIC